MIVSALCSKVMYEGREEMKVVAKNEKSESVHKKFTN